MHIMKIFNKYIALAVAASACLCPLAQAQDNEKKNNTDVTTSNRRFWEASLPGGNYMVALDRISSVSIHSYIISGSIIVHEVDIETNGSALARFYAMEMVGEKNESNVAKGIINRGKSLIDTAGKRTGVDTNSLVEKQYPLTTHAKTIEYRLFMKKDLDQLYNSLKRAWKENRGRKFTIR